MKPILCVCFRNSLWYAHVWFLGFRLRYISQIEYVHSGWVEIIQMERHFSTLNCYYVECRAIGAVRWSFTPTNTLTHSHHQLNGTVYTQLTGSFSHRIANVIRDCEMETIQLDMVEKMMCQSIVVLKVHIARGTIVAVAGLVSTEHNRCRRTSPSIEWTIVAGSTFIIIMTHN